MIYDPDEIRRQIEELEQQEQELRMKKHTLHCLPVLNAEGEIVSYADLEA